MIKPISLGEWSRLADHGLDKDAIFVAHRVMCIINHFREPNAQNPYGDYVATVPRRDGLFEHIFLMNTQGSAWEQERQEAIAQLRELCATHGDNDWPDELHLGDVIEKHLGKHLL